MLRRILWNLGTSQVVLVVKNLPANAGEVRDTDSIPGLGRSPGVGNDNPCQYSCLENSMDRGAWWATVDGVTKSWTQLSTYTRSLLGHQWSRLHGSYCPCAKQVFIRHWFYTRNCAKCWGHKAWFLPSSSLSSRREHDDTSNRDGVNLCSVRSLVEACGESHSKNWVVAQAASS